MIDEIVDNLVRIKQNFAKNYDGNAHIQEVIPLSSLQRNFQLMNRIYHNYTYLHKKNPIYLNSFEKKYS